MKTKRTLLLAIAAIFTVLLFLPVLSVPAKAAAEYVFDDAGLLTVEERGTLSETLQFVSEEHNLDVIVITFDMAEGGDPAEHAADLYEANGIGVGDHENAIIFDLRVNGEEGGFGHVTQTFGTGQDAFTVAGINYITSNVLRFIGDYFSAFMFYASAADDFMYAYEEGTPYDGTTLPAIDVPEPKSYVYENAGVLSAEEAQYLNKKLAEISERHDFAVIAAATYSLGGKSAEVYGADFLESIGLAQNGDSRCCILVIATEERDFGFATPTGVGSEVFTYSGQDYLDTFYLPYLRNDDYFGAFLAYAEACDDFLNMYEAGTPYGSNDEENVPYYPPDSGYYPEVRTPITACLGYAAIGALIITIIVTAILSAQLKTVRPKLEAKEYVVPGSLALTRADDRFTHTTMSQVRIDTDSGNHGGGGGGGHSFSSSSGGSFSGHSGKY